MLVLSLKELMLVFYKELGLPVCPGTILFMYLRPSTSYALEHDMIVSTFNTIVIPMLNPIVYNLRNKDNKTCVHGFILKGLTDSEEIQLVLSVLFLLIYLVTMLGNIGMVLTIHLDIQLHTPMYFFLRHPSFLDLCYSNVIMPKTLGNLVTSNKSISFTGCFTQMYFFILFGGAECFLLSFMAYDHYVAICNPLQYPVIMSSRLCSALLTETYMIGFMDSSVTMICMSRLHFCHSIVIHHFFCDTSPILALSCEDTFYTEIMAFIFVGSTLMVSLITISLSYVSIFCTILKIDSTLGKQKAFSTCASHLLRVIIFYSTVIFTYLKPTKSYSLGKDQVASVFYTIVILMLNPLIYSLRNKEVKNAFNRVMQKRDGSKVLRKQ
ncbi:olfactory receptor 8H1-like [Castor canadensis]|uniref:Olfactory receptor 8H1-like n=1 Tax=Castor canadensis TaxID=51338 RepID=A0AC58L2L1_CASCN